jgi:hypothetical protein
LRTHHGFERFERHFFVLAAATDADCADHLAAGDDRKTAGSREASASELILILFDERVKIASVEVHAAPTTHDRQQSLED